ncbi:MAG: hypothetical protein QM662_14040 [Gordonia sp. (in: high G+C Gram-positive bacteria)]
MSRIHIDHGDGASETDAWLVEAGRAIDEPEGDVEKLISSIGAGLGRVRRPSRRLRTDDAGITVGDRVVKQLIARRVRRKVGRLVVFAAVDGEGQAVDGVRVGLVARFADDLQGLSDQVRDVVDAVLIEVLGAETTAEARRNIGVRWQDVYSRRWS